MLKYNGLSTHGQRARRFSFEVGTPGRLVQAKEVLAEDNLATGKPVKPLEYDVEGGTGKTAMTDETITIPQRTHFQVAMVLAILADVIQIVLLPFFVEGAESPVDDILDLGIAVALIRLLGWNWEFLPSFLGKLVPGVDLVPFWTLAVANVYRRSKRFAPTAAEAPE
jgi:hypothetical protein